MSEHGNCISDHGDKPRRAADGLRVCAGCQTRTRDGIVTMPALWTMLAGCLTGGASSPVGEFVRSSPTPGLNLNDRAATARTDIRNHLHCWARIGLDEGPWKLAPVDTLPTIAAWIAMRLDWYLAQDWSDEFVRETVDLARTANSLRQPETIRRFEVGPCPEPDCGGTLLTELRATDSLLPSLVWCDKAPVDEDGVQVHVWPADQWYQLGRKIHGSEVTA